MQLSQHLLVQSVSITSTYLPAAALLPVSYDIDMMLGFIADAEALVASIPFKDANYSFWLSRLFLPQR